SGINQVCTCLVPSSLEHRGDICLSEQGTEKEHREGNLHPLKSTMLPYLLWSTHTHTHRHTHTGAHTHTHTHTHTNTHAHTPVHGHETLLQINTNYTHSCLGGVSRIVDRLTLRDTHTHTHRHACELTHTHTYKHTSVISADTHTHT